MTTPQKPKIYHIVHVDRLASIVSQSKLCSDAIVRNSANMCGTSIGIQRIKDRRARKALASYPDLHVGDCVPFYFCPRSVTLYLIHKKNSGLAYNGGQDQIIHFKLDMHDCIQWASQNELKWAFTNSNAGSNYFDDFSHISNLKNINWQAVFARQWNQSNIKEGKQAEFLIEKNVSFENVLEIGVKTKCAYQKVKNILGGSSFPIVGIKPSWYY